MTSNPDEQRAIIDALIQLISHRVPVDGKRAKPRMETPELRDRLRETAIALKAAGGPNLFETANLGKRTRNAEMTKRIAEWLPVLVEYRDFLPAEPDEPHAIDDADELLDTNDGAPEGANEGANDLPPEATETATNDEPEPDGLVWITGIDIVAQSPYTLLIRSPDDPDRVSAKRLRRSSATRRRPHGSASAPTAPRSGCHAS